jgi:hypothetical protein
MNVPSEIKLLNWLTFGFVWVQTCFELVSACKFDFTPGFNSVESGSFKDCQWV